MLILALCFVESGCSLAPTTAGGRGLVFTLGFVSILLFGAMLARAGNIASVILDTAISRVKLIQRRHVANALCWGAIWVSWMFFMAFTTRQWNRERLGADNDFTFGDGYWFAYISTTTVGLGDVRMLCASCLNMSAGAALICMRRV